MDASPARGLEHTLPSLLAPDLTLEQITLTVASLERSLTFYVGGIGLSVLERSDDAALLGAGTTPLLELLERPGVQPASPRHGGLYHLALLLPTRADLARFVDHLIQRRTPVQGASDHRVSEALYLTDPDGHGLEVYRDRPAAGWIWGAQGVQMSSDPLDLENLLLELPPQAPIWTMPQGSRVGHLHLRVSDLDRTETFYRAVLGFDVVCRFPGALFVSVGGYHHHLGLNVWNSRGGTPAPATQARLERARVRLPDRAALERLESRLHAAQVAFERHGGRVRVQDPAGNPLEFRAD